MAENLVKTLIPHQGCSFTWKDGDLEVEGAGQNWIMSAAVAPIALRAPFIFHVVGKTDSTNLRMHWHKGELIFNWECNVRELRVHAPDTGKHVAPGANGFLTPSVWHDITWEVRTDGMKVTVFELGGPKEVRYEGPGNFAGIVSAPSVGPCFGSRITIREFNVSNI